MVLIILLNAIDNTAFFLAALVDMIFILAIGIGIVIFYLKVSNQKNKKIPYLIMVPIAAIISIVLSLNLLNDTSIGNIIFIKIIISIVVFIYFLVKKNK